jgi:hypothetical protein
MVTNWVERFWSGFEVAIKEKVRSMLEGVQVVHFTKEEYSYRVRAVDRVPGKYT